MFLLMEHLHWNQTFELIIRLFHLFDIFKYLLVIIIVINYVFQLIDLTLCLTWVLFFDLGHLKCINLSFKMQYQLRGFTLYVWFLTRMFVEESEGERVLVQPKSCDVHPLPKLTPPQFISPSADEDVYVCTFRSPSHETLIEVAGGGLWHGDRWRTQWPPKEFT